DLRFRLGYIIGSWKQSSFAQAADNAWDYGAPDDGATAPDPEADDALPAQAEIGAMQSFLNTCLVRFRTVAGEAKHQLLTTLEVDLQTLSGPEKEAAQDLFEDFVQSLPDFDDLVNDIMDEVRQRFERIGP